MIRNHRIGFMPAGSYVGMPPAKVLASLKEIGYDAVEWTMAFVSPEKFSTQEIRSVFEETIRQGLTVSEVCVQRDLILKDEDACGRAAEFVNRCIEIYAACGIDTINLFTGPVPWSASPLIIGRDITEGQAWEKLLRAFDRIVGCAEKNRMNIALENVWGMLCNEFYSAQYLVNQFNSPYLGVNLDVSHDILAGHSDIAWLIRSWKGKIKHVHLKDAAGIQQNGKYLFPLLGEGMIDWRTFIQTIEEVGYQGAMTVEFESFRYVSALWDGNWETAARQSYESLKKLFA